MANKSWKVVVSMAGGAVFTTIVATKAAADALFDAALKDPAAKSMVMVPA